jgi:predicted RNA-binding protein YlqC (UPF0109 family)
MTEFQKQCLTAENLVNAIFRVARDNPDQLTVDSLETLKTISKLADKMVENIEKPIKQILENQDTLEINNKKFYYKISTSKVFDSDKAKATLESLEYSLEDFTKLQNRKTLIIENL